MQPKYIAACSHKMLFKVISLDCARRFEIVNHYSKRNDEKELEVNTSLVTEMQMGPTDRGLGLK